MATYPKRFCVLTLQFLIWVTAATVQTEPIITNTTVHMNMTVEHVDIFNTEKSSSTHLSTFSQKPGYTTIKQRFKAERIGVHSLPGHSKKIEFQTRRGKENKAFLITTAPSALQGNQKTAIKPFAPTLRINTQGENQTSMNTTFPSINETTEQNRNQTSPSLNVTTSAPATKMQNKTSPNTAKPVTSRGLTEAISAEAPTMMTTPTLATPTSTTPKPTIIKATTPMTTTSWSEMTTTIPTTPTPGPAITPTTPTTPTPGPAITTTTTNTPTPWPTITTTTPNTSTSWPTTPNTTSPLTANTTTPITTILLPTTTITTPKKATLWPTISTTTPTTTTPWPTVTTTTPNTTTPWPANTTTPWPTVTTTPNTTTLWSTITTTTPWPTTPNSSPWTANTTTPITTILWPTTTITTPKKTTLWPTISRTTPTSTTTWPTVTTTTPNTRTPWPTVTTTPNTTTLWPTITTTTPNTTTTWPRTPNTSPWTANATTPITTILWPTTTITTPKKTTLWPTISTTTPSTTPPWPTFTTTPNTTTPWPTITTTTPNTTTPWPANTTTPTITTPNTTIPWPTITTTTTNTTTPWPTFTRTTTNTTSPRPIITRTTPNTTTVWPTITTTTPNTTTPWPANTTTPTITIPWPTVTTTPNTTTPWPTITTTTPNTTSPGTANTTTPWPTITTTIQNTTTPWSTFTTTEPSTTTPWPIITTIPNTRTPWPTVTTTPNTTTPWPTTPNTTSPWTSNTTTPITTTPWPTITTTTPNTSPWSANTTITRDTTTPRPAITTLSTTTTTPKPATTTTTTTTTTPWPISTTTTPNPATTTTTTTTTPWPITTTSATTTTTPTTTIPTTTPKSDPCNSKPCSNNGRCMQTLDDYVCICHSNWTGKDCSETAVCNQSSYTLEKNTVTFDKIILGSIGFSNEKCKGSGSTAGLPLASRYCMYNGSLYLTTPNKFECGMDLAVLKDKLDNNSQCIEQAATQVVILTKDPRNLTVENVTLTTKILSKIMINPKQIKVETANNAIQTFCNMLETKVEIVNQVQTELLSLTEYLENMTNFHDLDKVCPQVAVRSNGINSPTDHNGLGLVSYQDNANDLERDAIKSISTADDFNIKNLEAYIFVPNNSFSTDTRFGFVLYKDSSLFPTPKERASIMLKTPVISGTVSNHNRALQNPVTIKLKKKDLNDGFYLNNYECAYWNYTANEWQTNGCKKVIDSDDGTHFSCCCSHLTSFAILMSVNTEELQHLDIISYIGCALSILGLLATIIAPMFMRDYRKSVNGKLQINLSVALLGVYITFLAGAINSSWAKTPAETTKQKTSFENPYCTASTWFLHFFLLASFAWMCVQGIALYSSYRRIIQQMESSYFAPVSMGVAWGGAAVIAIITIAVKLPTGYRQDKICWLATPKNNTSFFSGENVLFWAFMFPVALMLLLNFVIFGFIMSNIVCNKKNLKSYRGNFKATLQKHFVSVFANTVTLGLCWVTGYLMLIKAAYAFFSTIFCILNSLQGVFIFLLCLMHLKEFRDRMKQPMNIFKREKRSNLSMSSLIIKEN